MTGAASLDRRAGLPHRPVVDTVFANNAEHPPLGRWLLGVASTMAQPLEIVVLGGPDPVGTYVVAARLAPVLAFAILVGLVTHTTVRRYGRGAGVVAGASLLAMPRVFAHAHLAPARHVHQPFLGPCLWSPPTVPSGTAVRFPPASAGAGSPALGPRR